MIKAFKARVAMEALREKKIVQELAKNMGYIPTGYLHRRIHLKLF